MQNTDLIEEPYDLYNYFDADNLDCAKRTLYLQTACGAWMTVEGDRVTLGCIIEGSDAEVKAESLVFPFTVCDLEHTIAWVEDRATELFNETFDADSEEVNA